MAVIPNENVNVADIGQVLIDNGGSVNINDPLTYFTPDAKIDMFSKKKPVVLKINFCQDFDPTKPDYYPEWWKGTSGDCGIKFFNVNPTDLPNIIDGALNGWEYQLPQGGENAPFRLGDFCGYDPNAKPFVEGFSLSRDTVTNKSGSTFTVNFIQTPNESKPTSLTFADFGASLANYYPAVYLCKDSLGYFISASQTVGNGMGLMVSVPTNGLDTGTWEVYTFLSERQIPVLSTLGSVALGYCYTIPYTSKKSIKIVSSEVQIIIHPTRTATTNTIHIRASVTSELSRTNTFTNNWVMIRQLNADTSNPLFARNIELGTLTIKSGETIVVFDQDVQVDRDLYNNGCTVYVTLNTAQYSAKTNLIAGSPPPSPASEE
jgi:hypothetical protein